MASEEEWEQDRTRSLEDLRSMRLMALLRDVIKEHGTMGAAQVLEVNYKTLVRTLESHRLTGRMSDALERMLLSGGGSVAARQRERFEALERTMGETQRQLGAMQEGIHGSVAEEVGVAVEAAKASLREELSRAVAELARNTAPPESAQAGAGPAGVDGPKNQEPRPARSHRLSRGVVTREPHPGEEDSYGGGMDSVTEWRESNRKRGMGTKLDQVRVRQSIMELEIEIIGEHKLTLPPNTEPLHQSEREGYLGWRRRALLHMQRERLRRELVRWVRMALTLRRWKS